MTHTYNISGMTCAGCVAKVRSELLKLGDILSADVQLAAPQAVISMSRHISLPALQAAISKAGNYHIEASPAEQEAHAPAAAEASASYYPLLLIFGYITITTLLLQMGAHQFSTTLWMRHFMAGFFLVFSFFKLLRLRDFAEAYRSYDVVARVLPVYGYVYPFIELVLGILFLTGLFPQATAIITLAVMSISIIGVIQSLQRRSGFRCACLGTVINLPLSTVTLAEDALMILMSAAMLFLF